MNKSKISERDCKSAIFKIAIRHGLNPRDISTKLLSAEDKADMMSGELPLEVVELAVVVWKKAGCCDMNDGK